MPALNSLDPLPVLAPIGQPVGDNQGGVQEIYLLPQAALLRDPVRAGGSIVGDLALAPGAVWYPLRAVLDTAGFDEVFTQDRNQGLYVGKLAGTVAEDTPDLAAALLRYRNVRLVVLYRDGNDQLKLAGDTTSWYQLSYTLDTGTAVPLRNGYQLELAGSTLRPALFYQGAAPTLATGVPTLPPNTGGVTSGTVPVFNHYGQLLGTARLGQRITITSAFRVTLTII